MLKRAIVTVVATAVALVSFASAASPAGAASVGIATPTVGVCPVSGSATFSPGTNIVPQTINFSINVGGTCEGDPLGDPISLTIGGGPLLSCEAGFGPTADAVTFNDNPPGSWTGTGDIAVFPDGGVATVTAGIVVGVLTYAWTSASPVSCTAPTGVSSTGITGVFTYVSE